MFTLKLDQHHFTSLRVKTSSRWCGLSPRLSILDTTAPTKSRASADSLYAGSPQPPWTRAIARNSQQKPIRNPGFSAHSLTHPRPTHIPALHLSRLYKQTNHATLSCVGSWRFFLPVCDSGHATALFVNSRRITPTSLSLTKPARLVRTDPFSFRTEEATRPSLLNHQQSNLCALPLSFSLSSSFLSLPSDFPRSVPPRSSSGPRSLVPLCPFSPCSIQIPLGYGDQLRLTCN